MRWCNRTRDWIAATYFGLAMAFIASVLPNAPDAAHLPDHLDVLGQESERIAMKKAARMTAGSLTLDIAIEHYLNVYEALLGAEQIS